MRDQTLFACLFISCLALQAVAQETPGLPQVAPETVGLRAAQLNLIDNAVSASIQAGEAPGAVVLVARHGKIGYWKAFGMRSLRPEREPMTRDTIFDMASLTKVVATTPAVMLLTQNGMLRVGDRVRRYLPLFTGGGKENITVRQLLIHYSGLPEDFDLSRTWRGREAALEELWRIATRTPPGKEFLYSDLNFIALGEIVRTVSGQGLESFVQQHLYQPLGMTETTFTPPAAWLGRIAPTESRNRSEEYLKGSAPAAAPQMLRGEVHDPTAWRMGGVAGHAGLFSSARDLAIYAQMLLDRGSSQGKSILSPLTVQAMTSPQSPAGAPVRGFGWDIDTSFSAPRGDLFSGGFGHTGFTGTSLWIHPPTGTFVIILTSRLHPDGKGDVTRLRAVIANLVASAVEDAK